MCGERTKTPSVCFSDTGEPKDSKAEPQRCALCLAGVAGVQRVARNFEAKEGVGTGAGGTMGFSSTHEGKPGGACMCSVLS